MKSNLVNKHRRLVAMVLAACEQMLSGAVYDVARRWDNLACCTSDYLPKWLGRSEPHKSSGYHSREVQKLVRAANRVDAAIEAASASNPRGRSSDDVQAIITQLQPIVEKVQRIAKFRSIPVVRLPQPTRLGASEAKSKGRDPHQVERSSVEGIMV